ncbi:hypothetical protein [Flavobacterium sp. SORGH_AS_0622]|uniref:hypothetical protein n=1 Tax=Flavobacterium sp. SORGH_AS_0622 TaxID=3041772 RepID=UPI0027810CF5|nr:hypothetical protein [Flavobacterium sp. SORGH_AS_0622]MDQ1165886.1 hypothetical protein [Flavobacterium sp. SORGH_AS_0622]
MEQDKYSQSAVVTIFERMVYLLDCKSRIDVIFQTGAIPHDKNELDMLLTQYKDNVTKYVVDGDDVYYFRFGVPEYYTSKRFFGFPMSRLKQEVLDGINPSPHHQQVKQERKL